MKKIVRCTRGFTLLEIVITVALVAAAIFVYAATVSSVLLTRDAKHEDVAVRIAENELEGLRSLGYASLPASGVFGDSLLSSLASSTATIAITDFNAKTKQVIVTVSWQEGNAPRSVSVTTLITKTGGLK